MMTRILTYCVLALLAGCATRGELINAPPLPNMPDASASIRIHRDKTGDAMLDNVTFTINDEPIYQFGETTDFAFVTDPGEYLYGYLRAGKRCSTDVQIDPRGYYVFYLKPNCTIVMEKD